MALIQQNLEKLDQLAFHPVAARTATGEATGLDLRQYDGDVVLLLDSAAGGGTTPTLDVTVEHSDSLSADYTAISGAAFEQVVDAASRQKLVIDADSAKRYVRVKYTLAGTNPTFTFSVAGVGVKKYG